MKAIVVFCLVGLAMAAAEPLRFDESLEPLVIDPEFNHENHHHTGLAQDGAVIDPEFNGPHAGPQPQMDKTDDSDMFEQLDFWGPAVIDPEFNGPHAGPQPQMDKTDDSDMFEQLDFWGPAVIDPEFNAPHNQPIPQNKAEGDLFGLSKNCSKAQNVRCVLACLRFVKRGVCTNGKCKCQPFCP